MTFKKRTKNFNLLINYPINFYKDAIIYKYKKNLYINKKNEYQKYYN